MPRRWRTAATLYRYRHLSGERLPALQLGARGLEISNHKLLGVMVVEGLEAALEVRIELLDVLERGELGGRRLNRRGGEARHAYFVAGHLLGFVSLGPKQSEQPYSPADVRLLRSVASQTAFALENSRLTAAVASEVARAARMTREIEIAKEVQEQLFPQNYPKLPGLDIAGFCRPAAGVGGDYYDFLALKSGGLGVAIGDISGKGVPAALLMAGLQASLRGQALMGATDLAALMDNVNVLLLDSSPANRYATFFYGQYDPKQRRLHYVNAGHNAPMLFRGEQVLRLTEGGPVVGLLSRAPFTEAQLALQPGDLLLGFTDGISECMDTGDQEWGEQRLMQAIRDCRGLEAKAMIERLMAAADAFAAGAKQHDDMTLVVMKLLA